MPAPPGRTTADPPATTLFDRVRRVLPWAAVGLASLFALRTLDDFDTWWHLASGRWIVANGTVPAKDVLSFTVPDHDWTNLQWLYDVVLYGLHEIGGPVLLCIACAVAFTSAFAVLTRLVGRSLGPTASAAVLAWVVVMANERFLIRPEMATFPLLVATMWLVRSAREGEGRAVWWLVPVMLVWVNVHSLFVLGLVVIGAGLVSAFAAQMLPLPSRWKVASELPAANRARFVKAAAAALAVTFINPYFAEGVFFPLELLSRIDPSSSAFQVIGEFRPPWSGYFPTFAIGAYQVFFICAVTLAVVAALLEAFPPRRLREPPRFDLGEAAVFVALAYLSYQARRNVGVFALGAAPFFASCVRIVFSRIEPSLTRSASAAVRGVGRRVADVGTVLALVAFAVLAHQIVTNAWYARSGQTHAFGVGVYETNFPIRAADFAREQALPGPMYNDMTAGGYLTWADPTGGGVYIDGRLEVYDEEFFGHYQSTLANPAAFAAEAEALGLQSAMLFHRWGNRLRLVVALLRHPAWALVYHDEVAAVFVRVKDNEDVIGRARARFGSVAPATFERLHTPSPGYGWDVERGLAYASYARLLGAIGEHEAAFDLYRRCAELDLPGTGQVDTRMQLAKYYAARGERGRARLELERALERAPGNRWVLDMIARLDAS